MAENVTIPALQQMKRDGRKCVGVVAWDTPLAAIADRAGIDFVSVGDSVGVNLWGHANPLEVQYYSCVAYLLGTGQAMQYTIKPRSPQKTRVPKQPSANYLREAMAGTLSKQAVSFDFMIQLQTDPHRMPIEDASVRWPEHISPIIPVARLRIPAQKFDSPGQLSFAGNLAFNPWHSLSAHRPLGNQNRARKAIYLELSRLRQSMNSQPHIEPTGDERFDD